MLVSLLWIVCGSHVANSILNKIWNLASFGEHKVKPRADQAIVYLPTVTKPKVTVNFILRSLQG